ncbi:hypothetical protein Bpfe_000531 [Biomphalaria pfeifferi]|uniref:Uncharacterized protein n=1 Tax=Biomphalaria pfeifferi TaxID=112525 RepID=A0AAD8FP52_BIOPF|nr:hypothetical protein Bpfe_000531 [Biomphalaria pfeifferi]
MQTLVKYKLVLDKSGLHSALESTVNRFKDNLSLRNEQEYNANSKCTNTKQYRIRKRLDFILFITITAEENGAYKPNVGYGEIKRYGQYQQCTINAPARAKGTPTCPRFKDNQHFDLLA